MSRKSALSPSHDAGGVATAGVYEQLLPEIRHQGHKRIGCVAGNRAANARRSSPAARFYGWMWMDPAVGMIGAVVIASWSLGLIRSSGMTLLDMVPDPSLSSRIKEMLELNGDRVSDLHIWRVGPGHSALVASLVTDEPQDPSIYRNLFDFKGLPMGRSTGDTSMGWEVKYNV